MRYKGEYSPSFLLDPEEYSWHPLKECVPLLDKCNYVCFAHPERSSRRILDETNQAKDHQEGEVEKVAKVEDDEEADKDEDKEKTLEDEYEAALTAAAGGCFNPLVDEIQIISAVTRQGVEVVVGGPVSIPRLQCYSCLLRLL
jgi:hypothetical protein